MGRGAMTPSPLDRFWARVQLDLLDLPRPWMTLERLAAVDPGLHDSLCRGELWLVAQTDPADLERGWASWLRLYRKAVAIIENGEQEGPGSPSQDRLKPGPRKETIHD